MASGSRGTNPKAADYDNIQAGGQGTPAPSSVHQLGLNSKISNPKHHNYMEQCKTPASPSNPSSTSLNRVVSKPPPSTSFNRVVSKPPPSTSCNRVVSKPPPSTSFNRVVPKPPPSTSFNRVVSKPLPSTSSAGLRPNMFDPTSSHHHNREDVKSRPAEQFRSAAAGGAKEYSIWQKSSYLGSYQLPPSPLSANLPPYPFPGMGPKKLFNPKMPLPHHDNANNQRKGTDNENPN